MDTMSKLLTFVVVAKILICVVAVLEVIHHPFGQSRVLQLA